MNWKEEIIKFCICVVVISLSLWYLSHTFSKYYTVDNYITGGIVVDKTHYEARTDTTFTTDANGLSTLYTTYYPVAYMIVITKDGNDNNIMVDEADYNDCEIGKYYNRKD